MNWSWGNEPAAHSWKYFLVTFFKKQNTRYSFLTLFVDPASSSVKRRSYRKSQAFDGLVQWGILIPKGMGLVQLQKFEHQNLHNVIFWNTQLNWIEESFVNVIVRNTGLKTCIIEILFWCGLSLSTTMAGAGEREISPNCVVAQTHLNITESAFEYLVIEFPFKANHP